MIIYYNLTNEELFINSQSNIESLVLNGEDIGLLENEKEMRIKCDKPINNKVIVNGEEFFVKFLKLTNPVNKKQKTKNINGLKLINVLNNVYITRYNLTGKNYKIGIVDGGNVYKHYEFSNGNRVKFTQTIRTDVHATHVAGTMSAFGYNNSARGVARESNIYSYYFGDHVSSLDQCGKNGINSVNNSYGFNEGWSGNYYLGVSYEYYIANYKNKPIYAITFGKYTTDTKDIDLLANKYKNMIMCFAAGNDGTDRYTSGNWYIYNNRGNRVVMDPKIYPPPLNDYQQDNIGTLSCAKNIITVGATIDTSVILTNFSSTGGTDDFRIKPEVCANGDRVFSTINTGYRRYGVMSGTSMATPFATGSCLLIQQFIFERLKYFPISSTVKAVLVHGTNNINVNMRSGYGLINMNNSCKFLEDVLNGKSKLYDNELLNNENKYVFTGKNITVTLSWIDIAGTPTDNEPNNSKEVIVNRLGLYVENGGKYYYPFRYDKTKVTQLSSDSYNENFLVTYDNLQKIMITNLVGNINIFVKGINVIGEQRFSLCISETF